MDTELTQKMGLIKKFFDLKEILKIKPDSKYVKKYYKINKLTYSVFHTATNLIYMGISRDGKYKEDDLLEAARTVNSEIRKFNARVVLELATGRGANSIYLAIRNPAVEFYGIDISGDQLSYARKGTLELGLKNYKFVQGDYHDLSGFKDTSVDIVFVVEALCYSQRKELVLGEVGRVLRKGGILIIFDGYRTRKVLTREEEVTAQLVERGMALSRFEVYENFRSKFLAADFLIEKEEDVSEFILPTMRRFEKLAARFLSLGVIAKLLVYTLPKEFVLNIVSGYLMPLLVKQGVFCYKILVLRKGM